MSEPIIVAEIGINHNGDVEIAKKLIQVAKESGCDYVKFQKRVPSLSVPESQKNIMRETPWGNMTYLEYKERIEFGKREYDQIDAFCKEIEMKWFVSVWDMPSVKFMEKYNLEYYKIPSAHLTNDKLLLQVKKTGRKVMISTGMSTELQIDHAVKILGEEGLVIMHCNSSYPAPNNHLNLLYIQKLIKKYPLAVIGYSGHEVGLLPSALAVCVGARVIERHITLDRSLWGTDQAASVEPQGLRTLVRDIHNVKEILGDGVKTIYPEEASVLRKLRG